MIIAAIAIKGTCTHLSETIGFETDNPYRALELFLKQSPEYRELVDTGEAYLDWCTVEVCASDRR